MAKHHVLSGADRLDSADHLLRGRRVALLASASGVDREGVPTYVRLAEKYRLEALLAPEHGLRSDLQDGRWASDARDEETGARLLTLDRGSGEKLRALLQEIDVVVYDIQDVGARFYTYLYNLSDVMKACREANVPVVVLDRVNMISGGHIEGEMLDETRFSSGIGRYAIPTRYGLTVGEFAQYINATKNIGCDLTVIPCEGWDRRWYMDETDLLFVNPSPNIPSVSCAINYIGSCIWEATNISEGRGTTRPFDLVGAPFVDSMQLCREMSALRLPGVVFRRAFFTPMFNKYAGVACQGVELHITDREAYRPFHTMLHLYAHMRRYPEFQAREEGICLRFGSDALLGELDIPSFMKQNNQKLSEYARAVTPYLLYGSELIL